MGVSTNRDERLHVGEPAASHIGHHVSPDAGGRNDGGRILIDLHRFVGLLAGGVVRAGRRCEKYSGCYGGGPQQASPTPSDAGSRMFRQIRRSTHG